MMLTPILIYQYWVEPNFEIRVLGTYVLDVSEWTRIAWYSFMYGTSGIFGFFTLFWALSYIRERIFQKIYFKAMVWGVIFSWALAIWITMAFIIGGTEPLGKIGWNILYALTYDALLIGLEFIAYYLTPRAKQFYRWDDQEWWTDDRDDIKGYLFAL